MNPILTTFDHSYQTNPIEPDLNERTADVFLLPLRVVTGYTHYTFANGFISKTEVCAHAVVKIVAAIFAFILTLPFTLLGLAIRAASQSHHQACLALTRETPFDDMALPALKTHAKAAIWQPPVFSEGILKLSVKADTASAAVAEKADSEKADLIQAAQNNNVNTYINFQKINAHLQSPELKTIEIDVDGFINERVYEGFNKVIANISIGTVLRLTNTASPNFDLFILKLFKNLNQFNTKKFITCIRNDIATFEAVMKTVLKHQSILDNNQDKIEEALEQSAKVDNNRLLTNFEILSKDFDFTEKCIITLLNVPQPKRKPGILLPSSVVILTHLSETLSQQSLKDFLNKTVNEINSDIVRSLFSLIINHPNKAISELDFYDIVCGVLSSLNESVETHKLKTAIFEQIKSDTAVIAFIREFIGRFSLNKLIEILPSKESKRITRCLQIADALSSKETQMPRAKIIKFIDDLFTKAGINDFLEDLAKSPRWENAQKNLILMTNLYVLDTRDFASQDKLTSEFISLILKEIPGQESDYFQQLINIGSTEMYPCMIEACLALNPARPEILTMLFQGLFDKFIFNDKQCEKAKAVLDVILPQIKTLELAQPIVTALKTVPDADKQAGWQAAMAPVVDYILPRENSKLGLSADNLAEFQKLVHAQLV